MYENPMTIQKITIDLSNLVINEKVQHINKYTKIKEIVLKEMTIEEDDIVFYG